MAEALKNEKTPIAREMVFGRHLLRAALGVIFVAVTGVLALQGVSVRTAAHWLVYLGLLVATDLIANAVMNRIARHADHPSASDPGSRLSH